MIISNKRTDISLLSLRVLTGIATCLFLLSCDSSDTATNRGKTAHMTKHRVEFVLVENKTVSLTQTVSGTLEADTKIRLYNDESGRIINLPYHEGDFVNKGDLLVQLDNEIIKSDVAKAKASRQQAKVDYSRLKKLLPKKISTEEEVAHAKTDLDLAVAEENHQLTRLKRTTIKAPIDGLITRRLYEPGDLLAQQTHIQTIIDPNTLKLEANLAERWIPLVEKGQDVTLSISALGKTKFNAKVERIHPTIDSRTHKGIIEILLNPVPSGAKVGQFVYAEITLKASNRLILPEYTVHFEPEGSYVYRIAEDSNNELIAEKVFFTQGQQFESVIEALSELKHGDKIVSRGYLGLRDGKQVTLPKINNTRSDSSEPTKNSNAVK